MMEEISEEEIIEYSEEEEIQLFDGSESIIHPMQIDENQYEAHNEANELNNMFEE